jgi:hypothetical protein
VIGISYFQVGKINPEKIKYGDKWWIRACDVGHSWYKTPSFMSIPGNMALIGSHVFLTRFLGWAWGEVRQKNAGQWLQLYCGKKGRGDTMQLRPCYKPYTPYNHYLGLCTSTRSTAHSVETGRK